MEITNFLEQHKLKLLIELDKMGFIASIENLKYEPVFGGLYRIASRPGFSAEEAILNLCKILSDEKIMINNVVITAPYLEYIPRIESVNTGVGVIIKKDNRYLLGCRKNSHGTGELAIPGGHLELSETLIDCGKREVFEETGIRIKNTRFLCITNLRRYLPKHYIDIILVADWESGEVELREPDKCEGWNWMTLEEIKSNHLYAGTEMGFIALENPGQVCFEKY